MQESDNGDRISKAGGNDRILVAEDDLVSQMVTAEILKRAGYQVDVVPDGNTAINYLKTTRYNLILMDCHMPGMDGFTLTEAIRQSSVEEIDPGIPIIALTALTSREDRQKCMDAGMDDWISKPVQSSMLIDKIQQYLGVKSGPSGAGHDASAIPGQQVREKDFLDSVIDKFVEQIPLEIAGLQEALNRGDMAGLRDISHRLRGAAAIIRAGTVSRRAQAVEQAVDPGLVRKFAEQLIEELQKLTA